MKISATLFGMALGHGAMLNPRPRSSHSQNSDDWSNNPNHCGSNNPYSNATSPGSYCGLGCLGDACLYYQIGCFQGCGSCSLSGKTLYPVDADVTLAGCDPNNMPEPTLGGGNATLEHMLRSTNINNESVMGDWTKWMPWRSPGSAGKGNPKFQPCGVNSGALASQPEPPTSVQDVPNGGPGTSLPELPQKEWSTWKAGSVVEAEWSMYANHAGGYSYRLCKYEEGQALTEECYQKTPLKFATPDTEVRYKDGSKQPFTITSLTTDVGTYPPNSQWRKNPVPMCNCDIGLECGGKAPGPTPTGKGYLCKAGQCYEGYGNETKEQCDSTCKPDPKPKPTGKGYLCKKGQCYSGWGTETKEQCDSTCGKSDHAAVEVLKPGSGMFQKYNSTEFRPGQTNKICPTGVQFPTFWDGGAGAGSIGGFGRFEFTMTDKLQVPDVPAGRYSVSWRWDCEETPQVWNSCADINIVA